MSNETLRFDSEVTTIKGVYKRNIKELKLNFKELSTKVGAENNPVKALEKEHATKVKELMNKSNEEIEKANLIFFMRFGDYYYELSSLISNKLVQELLKILKTMAIKSI